MDQDTANVSLLHPAEMAFQAKPGQRQLSRRGWALDLVRGLTGETLAVVEADGRQALARVPEDWQGRGRLAWEAGLVIDPETGEAEPAELVEPACPGEARAYRYATLLTLAAAPGNQVAGAFRDAQGEGWDGAGSLWRSSLRLDPGWMEALRRRSRARLRDAWARMMRQLPPEEVTARAKGWRHRLTTKLVTFTLCPALDRHTEAQPTLVRWLNLALRELGDAEAETSWSKALWAAGKGIESKIHVDGAAHVHAHLLALTRYLKQDVLTCEWYAAQVRALRRLCREQRRPVPVGPWPCLQVDLRAVRSKDPREGDATWQEAIEEVSKYITKPEDFTELSEAGSWRLLETCEVERWPRMFELLGAARSSARRAASLDTSCISALREELSDLLTQGREEDEPLQAAEDEHPTLKSLRSRCAEDARRRERPPSWRDLMGTLDLSDWLNEMVMRARRGWKFRITQIMNLYPQSELWTLEGRRFAGCIE